MPLPLAVHVDVDVDVNVNVIVIVDAQHRVSGVVSDSFSACQCVADLDALLLGHRHDQRHDNRPGLRHETRR